MSLKEIGNKLREERQRQGLSLEAMQQRSKIAPNILESIEEGRLETLPHPVYVKGFLKTYAKVLGLNPEDPELGLESAMEGVEPPRSKVRRHKPLTEVTPYPMQREQRRSNKAIILLVLLLLAAGGGYFIWRSLESAVPPEADNATSASNATEAPAAEQAAPAAGAALPAPKTAQQAPQLPAGINATSGTTTDEAAIDESVDAIVNATQPGEEVASEVADIARNIESSQEDEADNATAAAEDESADTAASQEANATAGSADAKKNAMYQQALRSEPVVVHAPADGGGQSVQIMAMEPCWIGFTIDQDAPKDFYLYAGQRASLRFDKTLLLRLGNAGGVRFLYNDEPFPTSYRSGEVKELRFPPTPE
ncbi:helix-turn-helix domain-containing protein [Oceanidesulfovibrio marinus]|uniref:DUF4115 domain-containing protein n=1 Tax=Oceanidesulfovibrio marinus TaxID=370038 RepID=A0ABX6NC64_9BACT|nr:helix-turn-helix domain-containing protein [Oceanidesulfovibrio marinus]QJT08188.1 DUF4115 domain-containing protein [Oceanidesulfovibrio marinus]